MSRANGFVERMQAGRDAAAHARHRGRATGGTVRLHEKPRPTITGWEYERQRARAYWQSARIDAHEDYCRDVYSERYEDIPW